MKSKNPKASLSLLRKEVEAVSIAKQCELIEVRMNGYRVTSSGSFGPTLSTLRGSVRRGSDSPRAVIHYRAVRFATLEGKAFAVG